MLDIARGLYTLRTGRILSKTAAGEWALREGLAPDPSVLERVLAIRKEPLLYRDDPGTLDFIATLGPAVAAFAVVLETAAINNRQKKMGYNAAKELLIRLGLNDTMD